MNNLTKIDSPKRPTNLSLSVELVNEAKGLGINISQACEQGLHAEVRKMKREKWLEENMEALESSNEYVRKHGLPLARYRHLWRG
jgi:antitoxin CcdA